MLIAPASRDVKCNLWLRLFCPLNCGKGTESASGLSFLYPWSHRKLWAPPRPRWLWTGTSVRLCCPCWPAAPPSLPALRTTHNWSTPLCRPSIGCAKDARSPKPRGTPSRSVCWLSASEAHFAHTLSFLLHSVYCIILSIPSAAIFLSLGHFSTFFYFTDICVPPWCNSCSGGWCSTFLCWVNTARFRSGWDNENVFTL